MNKIFILSTTIASVLMYAFTLLMLWGNDGRLSGADIKAIILDVCIGLFIFMYQYVIYRVSLKRIKEIIGIDTEKVHLERKKGRIKTAA